MLGANFDRQLDSLLHRLWDDLVREGRAAQGQLHNITAAIMGELRQDASEAAEFEQFMRAAGEDPHDEAVDEHEGHSDDEESALKLALDTFHEHLLGNESVIVLDNSTLSSWQRQYDTSMRALGDEEKEADISIHCGWDSCLKATGLPDSAQLQVQNLVEEEPIRIVMASDGISATCRGQGGSSQPDQEQA